MTDLTPYFAGVLEALGRPVAKAHRESVNRSGHFRRTKRGALAWVEPHQVLAHIAEHGSEPDTPESTAASITMGKEAMEEAMEEAIKGHNVVHAMHRKGTGWIDFLQGDDKGGIRHILKHRDEQHAEDSTDPDGQTVLRLLPEVIAKGRIISGSPDSAVMGLELNGTRAMLARTGKDHWLLTGFTR